MNLTAASRTATAHSVARVLTVSSVAVETLGDCGYVGCCPIQHMLALLQTGVRLLFIGAASVVLALAGILLSVVAAIRRAYQRIRGIEELSQHELYEPHSSPLRDRDHRGHRPQLRHRSTHTSRSSSNVREASATRTPLRLSPEPMLLSEGRQPSSPPRERRRRQRRAPLSPDSALPTIDSTMEFVEPSSPSSARPPMDVRGTAAGRDPVRALSSPVPVLSDSSPTQSTNPSIGSESTEERSRAERSRSPTRVLQLLKEHHIQLRERCLTRVHSMPNAKTSKPTRRTDPYQAPYYFPTPLSPDADIYVEQVLSERQGARVTDPITLRQYRDRVPLSPPTSPKSKDERLLPPAPDAAVLETRPIPHEPTLQTPVRPSLREKSHRWSWHLPHLHIKSPHEDAEPREESVEKPQPHARFLFGHHRRRNGTASEDMKAKRTSLPPHS